MKFLKKNPIAVLVVLLFMAVGVYWRVYLHPIQTQDTHTTEQETAAPSVTPKPSKSPKATAAPTTAPVGPPAAIDQAFRDRVLNFERLRISPVNPQNTAALQELATPNYMASHVSPAGLPSSDVVINVDPGPKSIAQMLSDSNGSRTVIASVSITRVRNGQPIDAEPIQWEVHTSSWKLVDGVWRVDGDAPVELK